MDKYQNYNYIYNWILLNGNPQGTWYNAYAPNSLVLHLLTNYETQCIAFINATSENKSLLAYISNNNSSQMINNHKSFLKNYGVYLY